jgi:predicted RNA-binding Zn ribbon-like protein
LTISQLRLDGGDAALDFANTLYGPGDGAPTLDVIPVYVDLLAWAVHAGLLDERAADRLAETAREDRAAAEEVQVRALVVRDGMAETFTALAAGVDPPPRALAAITRAHRDALAAGQFLPAGDGAYAWTWDDDEDLARPLWPVATAAIALLGDTGRLRRLKRCAQCRWLFVDASKNRSRRWCSMADCGSAVKKERYVAARRRRRRSAAEASDSTA